MVEGKRGFYPIVAVLIGMAGLFALSSAAQAQIDWSGAAGDGLWDTPGNWVGGECSEHVW